MSRKIKTILIALGVIVLLGGGYYGSTIYKKKKAEAASAANPPSIKIGNLDSAKVVKIEAGGLVLEKKGDTWVLDSYNGAPPPDWAQLDQGSINSLTYSLGTIYVERMVDDTPGDLSVYGLDKPSQRAVVTDSDGKTAAYLVGNMTPSKSSYYVIQEGDPKVYSVSSYTAEGMMLTLDKIRNKALMPAFETPTLTRFRIESQDTHIDISVKPQNTLPYLASSFSTFVLTSPYKIPRGVDSQTIEQVIAPLKNLAISDFIDDSPSSLAPYGLDKPVGIFLAAKDANGNDISIDLLVGSQAGGKNYAKLRNADGVFTLSGLDPVLTTKPFALVDKFPLLINIETVDTMTVTGGDEDLTATIKGKGDDAVYSVNGKKAEEKSFKAFYQAVIGLLMDSEYKGPATTPPEDAGKNITITFQLNSPAGAQATITLLPQDRDYYVLRQEGTTEFMIARTQVSKIYKSFDELVYSK